MGTWTARDWAALALVLMTAVAWPTGRGLAAQTAAAAHDSTGPTPASSSARHTRTDAQRELFAVANTWRVYADNDLFAMRPKGVANDFDYTHGMGLVLEWADAPAWLRRRMASVRGCSAAVASEDGCATTSLRVRQAIYTPASNLTRPVRGERPYAGYLGAVGALSRVQPGRTRTWSLELGTTGAPSLAEPFQRLVHNWTGSTQELGWDYQLAARPTGSLRYDEWRFRDARTTGLRLRPAVHMAAELGTLRTAAVFGVESRISFDRENWWLPSDGHEAQALGPFLSAGWLQEFVARDLFLDGHFFNTYVTSERNWTVQQFAGTVGWRFRSATVDFRLVHRTKEYEAQFRPHRFGAFGMTVHRWPSRARAPGQ